MKLFLQSAGGSVTSLNAGTALVHQLGDVVTQTVMVIDRKWGLMDFLEKK